MSSPFRRLVLLAAVGALAAGAAPQPADAYKLVGAKWTKPVLTVTTPARFKAPVADAVRAWNTSGVRIRFRIVTGRRADVRVGSLPTKPGLACGQSDRGHAGFATYGATRGAYVKLDPNCDRWGLVAVATHELGHVLGIGHETRRCALMNPVIASKCGADTLLPWEYICRPIYHDDIAGALRRYGGRARPIPADHTCLSKPVPAPAAGVTVEPLPAGTLAATKITWTTPADGIVRGISITRLGGGCSNHPILRTPYLIRRATPDLGGDFVGDVPATPGEQSIYETVASAGTWCYTVWTIGPENRWRYGTSQIVVHPGLADPGTRLGVSAIRAPKAGVTATIAWTTPTFPAIQAVFVDRVNGACPADPSAPYTYTVRIPAPATPGPMSVNDTTPGAPSLCYLVWAQKTGGLYYFSRTQV